MARQEDRRHIVYALFLTSALLFFVPLAYVKTISVGAVRVFAPIEGPLYHFLNLSLVDKLAEFKNHESLVQQYKKLTRDLEVANLRSERLASELSNVREFQKHLDEFERNCGVIVPEARRVNASVVWCINSRGSKQMLITCGADKEIEEGFGVLADGYVIGEVAAVSNTYSLVRLITDPSIRIPVRIRESGTKEKLLIAGNDAPGNALHLLFYPRNEPNLQAGYTVETSELNGYFDAGLPVGKVAEVKTPEANALFLEVLVTPFADLNRISYVTVVRPKLSAEERRALVQ